jgi:hypothetical protein
MGSQVTTKDKKRTIRIESYSEYHFNMLIRAIINSSSDKIP